MTVAQPRTDEELRTLAPMALNTRFKKVADALIGMVVNVLAKKDDEVFSASCRLLIIAILLDTEALTSEGVIDSQSVKTTENGRPRGYDAGKKIKGRKRHILTDTEGNPGHAAIHTDDICDREGAPLVLAKIIYRFLWLWQVVADGGYAGDRHSSRLRRERGPSKS